MRRSFLILIVAVVLVVRVPVQADDLLFDRFGEYLDSLRIQTGIPGLAAVIVGDNDIPWERVYGQRDVERAIPVADVTPFHFDGLTEVFTAALVLRCVEEGRLALEDQIGKYKADSPDANLTIRQVLTHTSGIGDNQVFSYRPDRLNSLTFAVQACRGDSFRATLASQLGRVAMVDSVPGPDVVNLAPPDPGIADSDVEQYARVLSGLAVPYAVKGGHPSPSQYPAKTLTATSGLISSARDYAQFDLALRKGVILRADTITAAQQPPVGRDGQPLPHGMGWWSQVYNGDRIAWQFGVGDSASSSLTISVPARVLPGGRTVRTLILVANSDGLSKGYPLPVGDVTASPFGKLFLGTFVK